MEIVVTHLTRMAAGYICVAGIDDRGRHLRPVLEGRRLGSDLLSRNGGPFALGARVDLGPTIPVGSTPEVEDVQFTPRNLRFLGNEPDQSVWKRSHEIAELRLRDIFGQDLSPSKRGAHVPSGGGRCSLGVLEPAYRPRLVIQDGKIRCHLADPTFGELNLSVTDVQFYLESADSWRVNDQAVARVQQELDTGRQPLIAVGLTRPWPDDKPAHWLQVNGLQFEP